MKRGALITLSFAWALVLAGACAIVATAIVFGIVNGETLLGLLLMLAGLALDLRVQAVHNRSRRRR